MLDADFVLQIHDEILRQEAGLKGFAGPGYGGLQGALARVEHWALYGDLSDVFGTASMYAVAIARGHIFNDANKRTALVTALTYLRLQGLEIERDARLEQIMVDVAEGTTDIQGFADILSALAGYGDLEEYFVDE